AQPGTNTAHVRIFTLAADGGLIPRAASFRARTPEPLEAGGAFAVVPGGLFHAEAGERLFIQLGHAPALRGGIFLGWPWEPYPVAVRFQAAPLVRPANDAYAGRLPLVGTNAVLDGDLLRATPDGPELPRIAGSAGATLWWSWRAPGRGTLVLRSRGTNAAPVAAILKRGAWQRLEIVRSSATVFGNRCVAYDGARPELRWDTAVGEELDLLLDRHPVVDARQPAVFDLSWLAAPPNDEAEQALVLEGNDVVLPVSNESATADAVPWEPAGSKSAWFTWTPAERGLLQVTHLEPAAFLEPSFEVLPPGGGSGGGVVITMPIPGCGPILDLQPPPPFAPQWDVYQMGPGPAEFNPRASSTDAAWLETSAAHEYRIRFSGVSNTWGTTTLRLRHTAAPPNDQFTNRIRLPAAAIAVSGRTAGASWSAGDPFGSAWNSVWWEWQAPHAGAWALKPRWTRYVNEVPGEHGLRYVIYRGQQPAAAREAGRTSGPSEPLSFTAAAGESFVIGVFGAGFGNNVAFALTEAASPALAIGPREWSPWDSRLVIPLHLAGSDELAYVLESSTNLVGWEPLATNRSAHPLPAPQSWDENEPARFFRTRLLE
ncbi:MAG: hypothetical protein ACKVYV_02885, partial [Limisphaerales bacterium]